MKLEDLEKAKELEDQIKIIDNLLDKYDPKHYIVNLQVQDHYGNKSHIIPIYAFEIKVSRALNYSDDLLRTYYKEFLHKSTAFLNGRKETLIKELEAL